MNTESLIDKIVISSRVRLARNFENIPFPSKLNDERNFFILKSVFDSIKNDDDFKILTMKNLDEISKGVLFEKHLISAKLISNTNFGAVILNSSETVSIMVCEEDHLRLQSIYKGFNLYRAFDEINKIDSQISRKNRIAYDSKLGYLTACLTNVGTGLRASVMLFLPALSLNNKMSEILNFVRKKGQTIRGLYGEGSGGDGYIYQVSNQSTLGKSENKIIQDVNDSVLEICKKEIEEREEIFKTKKEILTRVTIENAKKLTQLSKISIEQFMESVGIVRLGVELGIIKMENEKVLQDLIQIVQPNSLRELSSQNICDEKLDEFRSKYLKKILKNIIHF